MAKILVVSRNRVRYFGTETSHPVCFVKLKRIATPFAREFGGAFFYLLRYRIFLFNRTSASEQVEQLCVLRRRSSERIRRTVVVATMLSEAISCHSVTM